MVHFIVFACVLAVAVANPILPYASVLPIGGYETAAVPKYSFNYAVSDPKTGDNKAQTEYRDGDVVKGSYTLSEPDGTLRLVEYSADPATGFNAVVKKIGTSLYPKAIIAPAPLAPIVKVPFAPAYSTAYSPAYSTAYSPAYSQAYSSTNFNRGIGLGYEGYAYGGPGLKY